MLATNPICRELYDYGFDGRQNILEFWELNRDDILLYLDRKRPEIRRDDYFLNDFEAKVRWRSYIGIMLTLELSRLLRKSKGKKFVDLSELKVRMGSEYYGFEDFS